jgi:tRNA-binding EMAP/Myf-like protein
MVGKQVCFIANLARATKASHEGMILSAENNDGSLQLSAGREVKPERSKIIKLK